MGPLFSIRAASSSRTPGARGYARRVPADSSQRLHTGLRLALCVAAALALYLGWQLFWFQCDDAYIAFRYASNSRQGWGYTWNPPPFRAVEGYTSFLWVALLDATWRTFGVEPPRAANGLALAFSAASLALVVAMVLRLRLSPGLARQRTWLLALVLLGILSNRTFLAWTSSGLETALFGFLLLAWVHAALFLSAGPGASAWLSLAAGLMALARPDGLLFAAATLAILGVRARAARRLSPWPALPLLLPVAHVLWRRATYGYWLPNTYYAKHVAAWPEAGVRYFAAFLLEYAYWIALLIAAAAALRLLRSADFWQRLRAWDARTLTGIVVAGALAGHFAYYTLLVGGDHFEFRVYQHWVPLVLVGFAGLAEQAGLSPRRTLAALALMLLLGWPIPWLHWRETQAKLAAGETRDLRVEVAPLLPPPLRWYAAAWDELERWLVAHFVGIRHAFHRGFAEHQLAHFPSRASGSQLAVDGFPVLAHNAVGVPGWVLPNVAILDTQGLNDAVIARAPAVATASEQRRMAHDRQPPAGYVACFRPNLFVTPEGVLTVGRRAQALSADEIRACEARFGAAASP
jgi:arabinofuranosyltransferase